MAFVKDSTELFKMSAIIFFFRKKFYQNLEELQIDVDNWINKYNHERPHSGKHCYGKTPYQTFLDAKHIAFEKTIDENSVKNDDVNENSDSLDS